MEIQKVVAQIGIFMICAQTITHFRPKESYAKYLKMLLSIMLLIQIFQPFCSLFFGTSGTELEKSVAEFQKVIEESMEEAGKHATLSEERLQQMSLEKVQQKVAKQQQILEQQALEGELGEQKTAEDSINISVTVSPIEPVEIETQQERGAVKEEEMKMMEKTMGEETQ